MKNKNVFQHSKSETPNVKNTYRSESVVNLHQVVLKFCLHSRLHFILGKPEGANQSEKNSNIIVVVMLVNHHLKKKKMISTPLMMEKPVRSPMVPPMRLSWASVLIFLSLSMSSKVAVSK